MAAESADSGSLVRTSRPSRTPSASPDQEALERVARECVADLATDGVVYADPRRRSNMSAGLTLDQVVGAVRAGFEAGIGGRRRSRRHTAAADGDAPPGGGRGEIAELFGRMARCRCRGVRHRGGAEAGFPRPSPLDASSTSSARTPNFTIHAGAGFRLPSTWEAIEWCGADRLGHGVRTVDDITVDVDGTSTSAARGLPSATAASLSSSHPPRTSRRGQRLDQGHPIGLLTDLRSGSPEHRRPADERDLDVREMTALVEAFGYDLARLRWFTITR